MNKQLFIVLYLVLLPLAGKSEVIDSIFLKDVWYLRMEKAKKEIPVFYNEQVKKQIGLYLKNTGGKTTELIGKINYYTPILESKFQKNGLPTQLILAAFANTEFDPTYVSEEGYTGVWPISYAIAKKYNLKTTSYIDERRNIYKSTDASVKYFKDLQHIYKDWLLTVSAFGTGPINVNMALRRCNDNVSYYKVHECLTLKEQEIMVKFMALWYVYTYHNEHKLTPTRFKIPVTDTVMVHKELAFGLVAENLEVSMDQLRLLNPEFREDIIPASATGYALYLPEKDADEFRTKREIFFRVLVDTTAIDSTILLNNNNPILTFENDSSTTITTPKPSTGNSGKKMIYYKVKSGDVLGLIADIFDCNVSDIKKWNGLRSDKIYSGKKLKIYVPASKIDYYRKMDQYTLNEKRKIANKD